MDVGEGLSLRLRSVERHHSHTHSHTGLLLWAAAVPLAQIILRCPQTFQCESWTTALLWCGLAQHCPHTSLCYALHFFMCVSCTGLFLSHVP